MPPLKRTALVRRNIQLLWMQTNFDFIVGQFLVFDEKSVCQIPIRHNTLPNGDVIVFV